MPTTPSPNTTLSHDIADYPEGIVLPIDKPYGWTSADVIRKVKFAAIRHFGKKNLKVGHAGTLDPLATGVLLVCIGNATKLAETFQSHDKEYLAGITFGATTPSYDLEKAIDRFFPHENVNKESVAKALNGFLGEQDQIAPLFSAKYVDGVRAYELARRLYLKQLSSGETNAGEIDEAAASLLRVSRINITGIALEDFIPATEDAQSRIEAYRNSILTRNEEEGTPAQSDKGENTEAAEQNGLDKSKGRRINIEDFSDLGLPRATIRVACTKGTYIRSLARDLGEALGTGAFLHSLRRTATGSFRIENALSVDQATQFFTANKYNGEK